jgi:ATP-binding cassette, subfamily F, member 3
MASIEALITALKQFEGTLVFISHDVYFIKQLANQVVHVESGRVRRFAGDYNYYVEKTGWGAATSLAAPKKEEKVERPSFSSKEQRRLEAEERQNRSHAKKQQQKVVSEIERRITEREQRQAEIHEALQDAEIYTKGTLAAELNRELKEIGGELEELHRAWEEEATNLEAFSG